MFGTRVSPVTFIVYTRHFFLSDISLPDIFKTKHAWNVQESEVAGVQVVVILEEGSNQSLDVSEWIRHRLVGYGPEVVLNLLPNPSGLL